MKVSPYIESLIPYKPGKPIEETQREYGLDKVYKLASNESPLGPSLKVVNAIQKAASEVHRYPDASCFDCKNSVAEYLKVKSENIVMGNGSNELIDLLIRIYCEPGDKILTSQAAFIAYKICAQVSRVETIETQLTKDFKFDLDEMLKVYKAEKPKIIFIANPNNPTGTFLEKEKVRAFVDALKEEDVLIVFDEAYNEYVYDSSFESAVNYFSESRNVILLRTFSKIFALAGLRIGAMVAPTSVVNYVNRIRNPFNVNVLAQVGLIAAMSDREHLEKSKRLNTEGLEYFYQQLSRLGIEFIPSQGNFILFDTKKEALKVYENLLKQGVIVRPVVGYGFPTYLRISVGTTEENQKAIEALEKVL